MNCTPPEQPQNPTKTHGNPDNEFGLFVPLQFVLTLEIECNPQVDEALVEAFQKAYPKLVVEVIE